jgi:hypothetical protein
MQPVTKAVLRIASGERVDPLSPEAILDQSIPWQHKLLAWGANQGIPTVLLLLILFGLYDISPKLLDQIQEGYNQNAAELARLVEVNDKQIERMMTQADNDRKLLLELLQDVRQQTQPKQD